MPREVAEQRLVPEIKLGEKGLLMLLKSFRVRTRRKMEDGQDETSSCCLSSPLPVAETESPLGPTFS